MSEISGCRCSCWSSLFSLIKMCVKSHEFLNTWMLKYEYRGYQTASRINHQLIELHSHTHIHQYKGQQLTHLSDGRVTGSQSVRALFRWAYQVLSWQRHSSIHSQLSLVENIALCCWEPCGHTKCLDTDEDLVHSVTLRHLFKTLHI